LLLLLLFHGGNNKNDPVIGLMSYLMTQFTIRSVSKGDSVVQNLLCVHIIQFVSACHFTNSCSIGL